jgi:hypothetical protein
VAQSESARGQAELNLSYTSITAPANAVVGNRTLSVRRHAVLPCEFSSSSPNEIGGAIQRMTDRDLARVTFTLKRALGQQASILIFGSWSCGLVDGRRKAVRLRVAPPLRSL